MNGPPLLTELASHLHPALAAGLPAALPVASLHLDSRTVTAGGLFVAVPGSHDDGSRYALEAVRRGAVAVVAETAIAGLPVPVLAVPNARAAAACLADRFFGQPSRRLAVVGVTGTNGKTTTAFLIQHILQVAGRRCGMLGTITYDTGSATYPAPLTTPDAVAFQGHLAQMVAAGCDAAAVEVSSHALSQDRVAGTCFAAGVFTNLTRDHLDYHGDMDAYAATKARLFAGLPREADAVLNAADPWHRVMAEAAPCALRLYGVNGGSEPLALQGAIEEARVDGMQVALCSSGETLHVQVGLTGRHNAENLLAAALTAISLGVPLSVVGEALRDFPGVPGRLERIPAQDGVTVFVDYAHTDDALARVLDVLRPLTGGRLFAVFGCGGDRDRGKRPLMAQAAEARADRVVVTSDNPRTEDPRQIFADIRSGFQRPQEVLFEADRAAAIDLAIRQAESGDTVLLAGKGHEDYQILGTRRIHLDDRELARAALRARARRGGTP